MNKFKLGVRISLLGIGLEAIGIVLNVLHHLNIGLTTPEGLITGNHLTIFFGFLINFSGVLVTLYSRNK